MTSKPQAPALIAASELPPHSFEAEMGLLGCILANNRAYDAAIEFVAGEHFADPRHGRLFGAIGAMIERGERADMLTLRQSLDATDLLGEVGGWEYIAKLSGSVITVISAPDYARTIRDLAIRRRMLGLAEEMGEAARMFDDEERAEGIARRYAASLDDLAADVGRDVVPIARPLDEAIEMIDRAYRAGTGITGVTCGLRALDDRLGGLHSSDLVVLAGRPSMGKTALAMTIVRAATRAVIEKRPEGAAALVFSLEMSAEQLAGREIATATGVSADRQRRGLVSEEEIAAILDARTGLARMPLYIDDTPHMTIQRLRSRARRAKRRYGIGLIVVDYLQLLVGGRIENRVQEVSKITRDLKQTAKELDVPVVALSQLSREVERRDDKRPTLSDLRESGSIEQDADVVVFIYREEYYAAKESPQRRAADSDERFAQREADWRARMAGCKGVADLLIDKNRHGPAGAARVRFDDSRTTFHD